MPHNSIVISQNSVRFFAGKMTFSSIDRNMSELGRDSEIWRIFFAMSNCVHIRRWICSYGVSTELIARFQFTTGYSSYEAIIFIHIPLHEWSRKFCRIRERPREMISIDKRLICSVERLKNSLKARNSANTSKDIATYLGACCKRKHTYFNQTLLEVLGTLKQLLL